MLPSISSYIFHTDPQLHSIIVTLNRILPILYCQKDYCALLFQVTRPTNSFIFMKWPVGFLVKNADGFDINLTGFLYAVVSSSPNKATTASFRLDQELIYLTLCTT